MSVAIALFCFRRIDLLSKLMDQLKGQVGDLPVYVFIDGPLKIDDLNRADEISKLLSNYSCVKKIVRRKFNLGLAENIISGINELFENYEHLIYLEDDLNVSNDLINFYLSAIPLINANQYAFVTGYKEQSIDSNYYFYGAECLSWITSKGVWKNFKNDSKLLLTQLHKGGVKNLKKIKLKSYKILVHQALLNPQIWANNLNIHCMINDLKTFVPKTSKVSHLGLDAEATNYKPIVDFSNVVIDEGEVKFESVIEYKDLENSLRKYSGFLYYFIKYIVRSLQNKIKNKLCESNNLLQFKMQQLGSGIVPKNIKENSISLFIGTNKEKLLNKFYKRSKNKIFSNLEETNNVRTGIALIKNLQEVEILHVDVQGGEYEFIFDLYNLNQIKKVKNLYIKYYKNINAKIFIENLLKQSHKLEWEYEGYLSKYSIK